MLSTEALSVQIVELRGRAREVVLELLTQLGELDQRRGYSELGYSSMFDYMTRNLGYSEPTASRRIGALRCFREYPELREEYRVGKLTLTAVSEASKAIQEKRIEPLAISGKSTREVRIEVAKPELLSNVVYDLPIKRPPAVTLRRVMLHPAESNFVFVHR